MVRDHRRARRCRSRTGRVGSGSGRSAGRQPCSPRALGLLAGIVCWQVGELLGPGSFAERLTGARPGRPRPDPARAPFVVRAGGAGASRAVTPVLLASSLGPDDEDHATRWRRHPVEPEAEESGTIDDRGVLTTPDEPSP